jgi:hypothetical protein
LAILVGPEDAREIGWVWIDFCFGFWFVDGSGGNVGKESDERRRYWCWWWV